MKSFAVEETQIKNKYFFPSNYKYYYKYNILKYTYLNTGS